MEYALEIEITGAGAGNAQVICEIAWILDDGPGTHAATAA